MPKGPESDHKGSFQLVRVPGWGHTWDPPAWGPVRSMILATQQLLEGSHSNISAPPSLRLCHGNAKLPTSQGKPLSSSLIFLPPLYCKAKATTLKIQ